MKRRLDIIGAGKAGRTLARLWAEAGVFTIGSVLNRTLESSRAAVEFIGQGTAVERIEELGALDVLLVSTTDRALEECARTLAQQVKVQPGAIVFHLSGSVSSEALAPLRALGCAVASLHPVKSFADPGLAVRTFAGTFCALEGDAAALDCLRAALPQIGARCFGIDPKEKAIYHAGSVFASNYLTTLLSAGVLCLQKAGMSQSQALEVLCQIAQGTVANVAQMGPKQALTGPIARGEVEVVRRQLAALEQELPALGDTYRAAGLLSVELARAQGGAQCGDLLQIEQLLRHSN